MDIEVIEERVYTVKVGEQRLDNMRIASQWNGFTELMDPAGRKIIVTGVRQANGFADMFADIFNPPGPKPGVLLTGVDSLINHLKGTKK